MLFIFFLVFKSLLKYIQILKIIRVYEKKGFVKRKQTTNKEEF